MWLYVCGDSQRTYFLREEAMKRGHKMTCPDDAQVIVLPLPKSSVSKDLEKHLHRNQMLIAGLCDEEMTAKAKENGWKILRLYEDEIYQEENTRQSAEGALRALIEKAPFSFREKKVLVIGFGKLGKGLREVLTGAGMKVTVSARNPDQRKSGGEDSLTIQQAMQVLWHFDVIINTVPAQIIGFEALRTVSKDTLLMDISSSPYGFNLEDAEKLHLHAWRENGIPGRFCPKTAAENIMNCIERRCTL